MKKWVLHSGNEYYFAYWTVIGPKMTQNIQEAYFFDSKELASMEASKHWALTVYDPLEIDLQEDNTNEQ